jgi:hypothetical protein
MPAPTTGKPGTMNGPPPGYHPAQPYGGGPSHYQQPPYGGPPPPGGYMGWQGQQHPPYGGPGSGWNPGPSPPPMGMYRQGAHPPSNLERNNWNGYRGGPPPPPNSQGRRPQPGETSPSRKKSTSQDGHYWGQQWPQHQWSGGHPPSQNWQQPGPPPLQQPGSAPSVPQHLRGSPPNMWTGMSHDSTNPDRHIRRSPESISGEGMTGYPPSRMNRMDPLCQPIGNSLDGVDDMYMSRLDKKTRAEIERDKGRGNYRCGRCGAPKKGHICPYQPKLKRRPDEPPPVMRSAAIQVEMDEVSRNLLHSIVSPFDSLTWLP